MNILISIDDTDDLDSIGTGQLLQNLAGELNAAGLASCSFVTRHQLYIHPDIAYTSHNSAMCCAASTDRLEETAVFCRAYMGSHCAAGSDPGLCILIPERLEVRESVLAFGRAAKVSVLTKEAAYSLADQCAGAVLLSEHGGTGDGVIGALAGCGLRLSGNDGRIKGKLTPRMPDEALTVSEFCQKYRIDQVVDPERQPVAPAQRLIFQAPSKALYLDFQKTACAVRTHEDGGLWRLLNKRELMELPWIT